jgi:hypothetical protein
MVLGDAHRGVGIGQQLLGPLILGCHRNAHTDRDLNLETTDPIGLGEDGLDSVRGDQPAVDVGHFAHDHGELVAAQTSHDVMRSDLAAQTLCDLSEQLVAQGVAMLLVEALKPVEVEEQRHHGLTVGFGECDAQSIEQTHPVGQQGERIGVGAIGKASR